MRVVVNHTLCEGNARCMDVAPEVFVVGDDDKVRLLVERPQETLRTKVGEAVRRCPRQALSIEDG